MELLEVSADDGLVFFCGHQGLPQLVSLSRNSATLRSSAPLTRNALFTGVRGRGILRSSEKGPDPLVVTEGVYTLNLGWVLDCRSKTVEVAYYLGKFLAGGIVVVLFAVVSESFQPKRFAGLFSAAPSVLLASLIVTVLLKGTAPASLLVSGAVAGGVG